MAQRSLAPADIDRLKQLDSCAVSNAIEQFDVRPRNEGFICGTAACLFPQLPPMVGYAVTGTIRSSTQPIAGGVYYDRIEWWRHFASIPAPRVMVLQDVDDRVGFGAFVGEIHANIAAALDCIGCVTNGAVRDVARLEALGFHAFAGAVSPSHAYAHIVEWGRPVEIGGLRLEPGDLIHGDRHGVLTVPLAVAAAIPQVAAELSRDERTLIEMCRANTFSIDGLSEMFDRRRAARPLLATPPSRKQ